MRNLVQKLRLDMMRYYEVLAISRELEDPLDHASWSKATIIRAY